MAGCNPPLMRHYTSLLPHPEVENPFEDNSRAEICELPLIDLAPVWGSDGNESNVHGRSAVSERLAKAAAEWGFFQIVNHRIESEVITTMRTEQEKLFHSPVELKKTFHDSHSWGSPSATCRSQFSWSEYFHIPVAIISHPTSCVPDQFQCLRDAAAEYAKAADRLGRVILGLLAVELGMKKEELEAICEDRSCFLRLNRYPVCPLIPSSSSPGVLGLVPHTDSDFLTILCQDDVGGLQLRKDSRWFTVSPNKEAIVVNVGDLLQAWSNDRYKSAEHKVMVNDKRERYSVAYLVCPSYDTVIRGYGEPSKYRNFTFGEYRSQVQEDVKSMGNKVGLSRFFL